MNIKRKMVDEKRSVDLYSFEGKLNDVREYLNELEKEYGADAKLDLQWDYDYVGMHIHYQRLETEKEAEKRVAKARKVRERNKANKLKQEEAERKELARLLKKYGNEG